MNSRIRNCIVASLAALLTSCESTFEPKTEFIDRAILYGIVSPSLRGPTIQDIMLGQTYNAEGTKPPATIVDRPITSARVVLTIDGEDNQLHEALYAVTDAEGKPLLRHMYTTRPNAVTFRPGQTASITAELPDGRTLTASTTAPPFLFFDLSYPFLHGITTTVRGLKAGKAWTLSWDPLEDHLFWPQLTIEYEKKVNDSTTAYLSQAVAMEYAKRDNQWVPIFPTYSWQPACSFTFDAIDSAMAKISEGDPNKSAYRIISATFSVTTFDPHLARYYASVHGSLDEYSIRPDPSVYTNVNGGLGVFGSETLSHFSYMVDVAYVMSFGYRGGGG